MADKDRRSDDEADKNETVKGSDKKDAGSAKSASAPRKRGGDPKPEPTKKAGEGSSPRTSGVKAKAEPTKKSGESEGGHGRGPLRFIREVVEQLRKVIRPSRKEMLTYTAVVLVFVSVMIALISGLDLGFTKLISLTFGSGDTGQ